MMIGYFIWVVIAAIGFCVTVWKCEPNLNIGEDGLDFLWIVFASILWLLWPLVFLLTIAVCLIGAPFALLYILTVKIKEAKQ